MTTIQEKIEEIEAKTLLIFKPSKHLYQKLNINRIRFWQLVKGTKTPTPLEIKALSDYFKIPQTDFLIK
jgi:hypothetical protein